MTKCEGRLGGGRRLCTYTPKFIVTKGWATGSTFCGYHARAYTHKNPLNVATGEEVRSVTLQDLCTALHITAGLNHNIGEGPLRAVCSDPKAHMERAIQMMDYLIDAGKVATD